ncbi:MAG TPA: hypothetical protein DHU63_01760 [Candidatus Marinimicrobia bacterium]|nr:hypothetical protein [Candidatus Neomarinimicrobiota bacterium]
MSPEVIIFGIAIIILGGGFIAWFFSRRKNVTRMTTHDLEIQGLNLLLQERPQEALEIFLNIARRDTNNVRAYMQVADLYRQLGSPRKSIDIHDDLLNRPGVTDHFKTMIYQSLAEDHEVLGQFEKALEYVTSVLKINKKDPWAIEARHTYLKALRDWEKASDAFEKLQAIKPDLDGRIPTLYKVEEALVKLKNGDKQEAVSLLKQAIKIGKPIPAAYYHLGKINQSSGQLKHAIDYYTSFAELDPELGSLVFPEIEKMYFELGQFDSVEQFYNRLRAKQLGSIDVAVGLAGHLESKGELEDALSIIDESLQLKPLSHRLLLIRLNLLNKLGKTNSAQEQIQSMLASEYRKNKLTCKHCGHSEEYPVYLCSECGNLTFNHD